MRVCVAAQVTLILLGWAFVQFPYLVEPDMTIYSAAAPRNTLQFLIVALADGVLVLRLLTITCSAFKGETSTAPPSARRNSVDPKDDALA